MADAKLETLKFLNQNYYKLRSFTIGGLKELFSVEECAILEEILENEEKREEIEKVFGIEVRDGIYNLKRKDAEYLTEKLIENIEAMKMLQINFDKHAEKLKESWKNSQQSSETNQELRSQLSDCNIQLRSADRQIWNLESKLNRCRKNLEEERKRFIMHNPADDLCTMPRAVLSKMEVAIEAHEDWEQYLDDEILELREKIDELECKNEILEEQVEDPYGNSRRLEEIIEENQKLEAFKTEIKTLKFQLIMKNGECNNLQEQLDSNQSSF